MGVNLDTSLNVGQVQQNNLQSVLTTLDTKTEPAPILGSKSLSVTSAPMNLDALVAKLSLETNNMREDVAKTSLSSAFSTIIANAERVMTKTDNNIAVLDDAKNLNKQLAEVEAQIPAKQKEIDQLTQTQKVASEAVNKAQEAVDKAQSDVDKVQNAVDKLTEERTDLENQISMETDPAKKAQLEAKRDVVDAKLADATAELATAQNALASAQGVLSKAQTNLNNVNSQLTTAKTELANLQEQKTNLKEQVKNKLKELQDVDVDRAVNEALKQDAKDGVKLDTLEKDQEEDEERYLDTHSPLRIMQDAILKHDSEILDTINSKREDKI